MSKPEPDTKVCPFCAETIRAAAIKCRFCHSDLTGTDPVEPVLVEPVPVEAPPLPPDEATSPEPAISEERTFAHAAVVQPVAPAGRRSRLLVAGAVVASLVASLVFGVLGFLAWRDGSRLDAAEEAGRTARATLPGRLETLLSYSYETFDDDRAAAEKLLTPSFREEYLPTVDAIKAGALEQERTQEATVVAVAIVSQSRTKVQALVFVNRLTYTEGSKKQRILQDRANVDLTRSDDGSWLIDDITFP